MDKQQPEGMNESIENRKVVELFDGLVNLAGAPNLSNQSGDLLMARQEFFVPGYGPVTIRACYTSPEGTAPYPGNPYSLVLEDCRRIDLDWSLDREDWAISRGLELKFYTELGFRNPAKYNAIHPENITAQGAQLRQYIFCNDVESREGVNASTIGVPVTSDRIGPALEEDLFYTDQLLNELEPDDVAYPAIAQDLAKLTDLQTALGWLLPTLDPDVTRTILNGGHSYIYESKLMDRLHDVPADRRTSELRRLSTVVLSLINR